MTLELVKRGKSIAVMAKERSYKEETIINHLEKLRGEGRVSAREVKKLMSAKLVRGLPDVRRVFGQLGVEKLAPTYYRLKGRYTYNDLKLARMVVGKKD